MEAALLDGTVTDKERAILEKLQESLGIAAAEAFQIEEVATQALGLARHEEYILRTTG